MIPQVKGPKSLDFTFSPLESKTKQSALRTKMHK